MKFGRLAGAIALGLALGFLAALSDVRGSGFQPQPAWRAVSIVTNAGSIWAGVAVLAGAIAPKRAPAALAGMLALAAAVGGYYLVGVGWGNRADIGLGGLSSALRFWLVGAVLAGPVLGWIGSFAREDSRRGILARMVVPALVLVDLVIVFGLRPRAYSADPLWAWILSALAVGASVALLWGVARWRVVEARSTRAQGRRP